MRLRAHRVPEENEHVKVTRSDQRADLLVTAEWPALEAGDGQVQAVTQHLAGRAGRIQDVTGEDVTVVLDPLEEVTFPVVVRDQGDVLRSGRGHDSTMGGKCCRPGTGTLSIHVHSVPASFAPGRLPRESLAWLREQMKPQPALEYRQCAAGWLALPGGDGWDGRRYRVACGRAKRTWWRAVAAGRRGTGPRFGSRRCVLVAAAGRRRGPPGCPVSGPAAPIGGGGWPSGTPGGGPSSCSPAVRPCPVPGRRARPVPAQRAGPPHRGGRPAER